MSDPVVLLSTGDVVGPAGGVTDNSMVLFSGTSGKLIKGNNAAVTAAGLALLDDVNAAAQRVTLGLGNVDNTSDVNKPISTATQTALNLKAPLASPALTGVPIAPTAPPGTNTTQLATTAFVQASTPLNLKTSGISGSFSNLKASATGTNATVTVTANSICLKNASNEQVVLNAVSVAPSLAASGANGLDAGASATNTWYAVWVIWNGTTTAGLLSLSATAPTMPSGYTHKARAGFVRADGTANKFPLPFVQDGVDVDYAPVAGSNLVATPIMSSGVQGVYSGAAYTPVAVAVANFIPPTATAIKGRAHFTGNTLATLAVTAESAGFTGSPGLLPPTFNNTGFSYAAWNLPFEFLLRSTSIYWASGSADGILRCNGWRDNI